MSSFPSSERIIPIQVLAPPCSLSPMSSPANAQCLADRLSGLSSDLNLSDPTASRVSRGSGSSSKRASLIITHSDGSIEENLGFVTSLGMSDISMDHQAIDIQEIGQETLLRELNQNKLQVILPEASNIIVEELMEGSDFSETSSIVEEDDPTTVVVGIDRSSNPLSLAISGSSWSPTISSTEQSHSPSPPSPSQPIPIAIQKVNLPSPSSKTPRPIFKPPPPPVDPTSFQPHSQPQENSSDPIDLPNPLYLDLSGSSWSPTMSLSSPETSVSVSPNTFPLCDTNTPSSSHQIQLPHFQSENDQHLCSLSLPICPTAPPSAESGNCQRLVSLSPTPPPVESENYEHSLAAEPPASLRSVIFSVAEGPVTQESRDCRLHLVTEHNQLHPVTQGNTSYEEQNQTVESQVHPVERKFHPVERKQGNISFTEHNQTFESRVVPGNVETQPNSILLEHRASLGDILSNLEVKGEIGSKTVKPKESFPQPQPIQASLLPGPIVIPIQRENLIESNVKSSFGQSRQIKIGERRHSVPGKGKDIMPEQSPLGTNCRNGDNISLESAGTSVGKAQPVRIVPISFPDDDTQEIHVEMSETNSRQETDSDQVVGRQETYRRQEKDSDQVVGDHTGDRNMGDRNTGDRVIPIQLDGGRTVMPAFTKLEDSEPPVWSVFRPTGNEKERLVPIQRDEFIHGNVPIQTNEPKMKPVSGSVPIHTADTTAKSVPGKDNVNKYQQTHVAAAKMQQGKTDDLGTSSEAQERKRHESETLTRTQNESGSENIGRTRLSREEQVEVRNTLDRVHQELETAKDRLASQVAHLSAGSSPVTTTLPKVRRPSETGAKPGTTSSLPGTTSSLPGTTNRGTTSSHPGATSSHPGTTSSLPGTTNRGTTSSHPGATSSQSVPKPTQTGPSSGTTTFHPIEKPSQTGPSSGTTSFHPMEKPTENSYSSIRSRSLDNKHRNPLPRNGARPGSCHIGRERSMEDINKDIELIWKELQELDSLPTSRPSSRTDISSDKAPAQKWSEPPRPSSATPSSEQKSYAPWRTMTPPPYKYPPPPSSKQSTSPLPQSSRPISPTRQSTSPTNLLTSRQSISPLPPSQTNYGASPKTEANKVRHTIWDLPPTSQPKSPKEHSSYASPNSKRPALFPTTPVNINSQGESDPLLSSSWNNKPQYNPVTSGHFSFHTKSIPTKPGSITPTYVSTSPRLSTRSSARSNAGPNVKTRSASSNAGTSRVAIVETGLPFPGEVNNSAGQSESQQNLKSCLKTDNREAKTRFIRTRSESPAGRSSPSKLNVNFKPDTTFYTTKDKSGGESTYDTVNSYKTNGKKDGNIFTATTNRNEGTKETPLQSNVGVREVPIQKENTTSISAINTNGLPTKGIRHVPIQLEGRDATLNSQDNGISPSQLKTRNVPIQSEHTKNVPIQSEHTKNGPILSENKKNVPITHENKTSVPLQPEKNKYVSVQPDKNVSVSMKPAKKTNMSVQAGTSTETSNHQTTPPSKQEDRGREQSREIPTRSRTSSQNRYGKESKQNNRISDPGPSSSGTSGNLTTDEACFACDACTQTTDKQLKDKKGACIVM